MSWMDKVHALNNPYDICILGQDGIGKSSLVYTFVNGRIPEIELDTTEEFFYTKNVVIDSRLVEISILDTSNFNIVLSQKEKIKNAKAIIFAFALDDINSFYEVQELHERLCVTVPVYLVGLKSDRLSYRQVSDEEIASFLKSITTAKYCECSTVNDIGINEVFDNYIDHLRTSIQKPPKVEKLKTEVKWDNEVADEKYRPKEKLYKRRKELSKSMLLETNDLESEGPQQLDWFSTMQHRRSTDDTLGKPHSESVNSTLVKVPTSRNDYIKEPYSKSLQSSRESFFSRSHSVSPQSTKEYHKPRKQTGCCIIA